jgi:hypothetical protein
MNDDGKCHNHIQKPMSTVGISMQKPVYHIMNAIVSDSYGLKAARTVIHVQSIIQQKLQLWPPKL